MSVPGAWVDPATATVRSRWLAPLVEWLASGWLADDTPRRLLDLGCGDALLSALLPERVLVDGFDPAPEARAAARRRTEGLGLSGTIFDRLDEVPTDGYDAVVASSVVQYVPGPEALGMLLGEAARVLWPNGSGGIVVTDVPSSGISAGRDASDSFRFLRRELGWRGAVSATASMVVDPAARLNVFDPSEVRRCADHAGLRTHRLDRNLSPFKARASYRFDVMEA